MKKQNPWFALVAPPLAILLTACGSTGSLGSAAERLDRSARHFYEEVHADREPRRTANDAAELAEAAADFRRAVERSRAREDLRPEFERVAERYHSLRSQVGRPESRYRDGTLAFERVTEAYLDVDRAMNHPGSR